MVIQGYGLSEAVNFSCLMPTNLNAEEYSHWMMDFPWPSIGTALRGNTVLVLNQSGEPTGEGEIGEIAIQGKTLMRGYRANHSNNEMPADNDGFEQSFLGNLLRTGDLGFFSKGT